MSSKRKGFGFGARFGRDDDDRQPAESTPETPGENDPPMVVYVPLRCPRCQERFPDHRGSGQGRFPIHYLVCKGCELRYRAQELDPAAFLHLVNQRGDK